MELELQSRDEMRKKPKANTSPSFLVQWQMEPQTYPGGLRSIGESCGASKDTALIRRLQNRESTVNG